MFNNIVKIVLKFSSSLPNSPAEPDFDADEHSARTQPRPIPHDEVKLLFYHTNKIV